jgi:xyloglucan-specific exo-beta-1,4-glucanase
MTRCKTWHLGTYAPDPSDSSGINSDKTGITFVTFDSTLGSSGQATPRIFVGVASVGTNNLFVSNDAGSTCMALLDDYKFKPLIFEIGSAISGTNSSWMAHKGVLSPKEKALYLTTSDGVGERQCLQLGFRGQ